MAEEHPGPDIEARARILGRPRIGDAAREAMTARLCEYRAHGFLTQEEFDARLDIIQAAKTQDEAARMFKDLNPALLPVGVPDPAPVPVKTETKRTVHPAAVWFWAMLILMAVLFGAGVAGVEWLSRTAVGLLIPGLGYGLIQGIREKYGKNW